MPKAKAKTKSEKTNALIEARKALRKHKEVDFKNRKDPNPTEQFPHVSTGSIIVNHLIGGTIIPSSGLSICPGVPRGRIIEVYGPESSGKTTLALAVAAQAQQAGGVVGFLDFENALHDGYAQALGVDYDNDLIDIWVPFCMEEGFEIINTWVEHNLDAIIIDSVSAMVPRKVLEGEASKDEQIGLRAIKMSQFLGKLVNWLRGKDTSVIFVNQIRSVIKTSKYDTRPDETTSGGNALKFYSTIRLKLQKRAQEVLEIKDSLTGQKKKKPIGTYTKVTCVKNKLDSKQGDTGEIFIRFGKGIDNIRTILDIAIFRKVITKNSSWLSYKEDDKKVGFKVQGKEKVQTLFRENPVVYEAIKSDVLEKISFESNVETEGAVESDEGDIILEEEEQVENVDTEEIVVDEDGEVKEETL